MPEEKSRMIMRIVSMEMCGIGVALECFELSWLEFRK